MNIPIIMSSTYSPDGGNIPLYRQGQKGVLIHIEVNNYKSSLCSVILDDGRLIVIGNLSFRVAEDFFKSNPIA